MAYIFRSIEPILEKILAAKKSILLLGPRQTGKTTLLKKLKVDLFINLLDPLVRQHYERDVNLLNKELVNLQYPLVVIDEIQKIPALLDVVQNIIDANQAQFILTGSSARKLKRKEVNLLPGRIISLELNPLNINEFKTKLPDLDDLLKYGSLPGIVQIKDTEIKERILETYVSSYLAEEIRAEALVRNVAAFNRFLELAANESGHIINSSKLSREIGVSHITIQEYYQILLDTMIAIRIENFSQIKTRRRLIRAPKYIFFDVGIRRLASREGPDISYTTKGLIFEQFVGLELMRLLEYVIPKPKLCFWRDYNGIEVDYVIQLNQKQIIPIEVKWTTLPNYTDCRHLNVFLDEYQVDKGYIIARVLRRFKLTDKIEVIPWQELSNLMPN